MFALRRRDDDREDGEHRDQHVGHIGIEAPGLQPLGPAAPQPGRPPPRTVEVPFYEVDHLDAVGESELRGHAVGGHRGSVRRARFGSTGPWPARCGSGWRKRTRCSRRRGRHPVTPTTRPPRGGPGTGCARRTSRRRRPARPPSPEARSTASSATTRRTWRRPAAAPTEQRSPRRLGPRRSVSAHARSPGPPSARVRQRPGTRGSARRSRTGRATAGPHVRLPDPSQVRRCVRGRTRSARPPAQTSRLRHRSVSATSAPVAAADNCIARLDTRNCCISDSRVNHSEAKPAVSGNPASVSEPITKPVPAHGNRRMTPPSRSKSVVPIACSIVEVDTNSSDLPSAWAITWAVPATKPAATSGVVVRRRADHRGPETGGDQPGVLHAGPARSAQPGRD